MAFIFQISAYNQEELINQLAMALEKGTELNSRQTLPKIWRFIDWMNRRRKKENYTSLRHLKWSKLYGALLLALGIFLLIPGLMSPKELVAPLLAGILATFLGINYLIPTYKKADQKSRKKTSKKINKKFKKAAIQVLDNLKALESNGDVSLKVHFDEEGMVMGDETVTYPSFDIILETEKLYLFIFKSRLIVLQKKDLIVGTPHDFIEFLNTRIPNPSAFVGEM